MRSRTERTWSRYCEHEIAIAHGRTAPPGGCLLAYRSHSHSFGAVFDNPNLIVACVVGDGEAETGPLANAWLAPATLLPCSIIPVINRCEQRGR
jgi:phosphoketolase